MNDKIAVNDGSTALNIISWLCGLIALFIGVVNTFWANDTGLEFLYSCFLSFIFSRLMLFSGE
jgi:hypothetical protein